MTKTKKKVTTKKTIKKKVEVPSIKAFSSEEMLEITLHAKELRIIELESIIMMRDDKIRTLEAEKSRRTMTTRYEQAQKRKSSFTDSLKKKHNITTDQLSYDPITGEIKDE